MRNVVTRENLSYTFKHPVNIELLFQYAGLQLYSISSSDEDENFLIYGETGDGEFACWDAKVEIKDGNVIMCGNDGPCGGSHNVKLTVSLELVEKLTIE